jgi:hypothetical protein
MEVRAPNIEAAVDSILALSPSSTQDLEGRLPHLSLQERSQHPKAHQLNLLTLQDLPQEPALYIETVPVNLTLGVEQRFWLVHQPTGLRVPGQFSRREAEYIFSATEKWDWEIDLKTREPACCYRFLWLLESICKPKKALGVAA